MTLEDILSTNFYVQNDNEIIIDDNYKPRCIFFL